MRWMTHDSRLMTLINQLQHPACSMHVTEGIRPFDTSEALPDCAGQCPNQGIIVVHLEAWVQVLERIRIISEWIISIRIRNILHHEVMIEDWILMNVYLWVMSHLFFAVSNEFRFRFRIQCLNQQGRTSRKNMTWRICAVVTSSM